VAAAGFLTRIAGQPISLDPGKATTHGESSLPLVGGISHSLIETPQLQFPDHISYGRCETFVEGRYEGTQTTITSLRASVNSVRLATSPSPTDNVAGVQSISLLAGSFSIEGQAIYPLVGQSSFKINPAQPTGLTLVTTSTEGKDTALPITLVFDQHFLSLSTVEEMDEEFLGNRQFFEDCLHRFPSIEKLIFGSSKLPRTQQGRILGSFVKQILLGNQVIPGNVLSTKGFGTIYFGVMVADPFSRRFTMAHVKMGSDPGGDADMCSVEDTGIWK